MVETLGYTVKRLKRIRIENIELGDLGEGEYKKFTTHERNVLFAGLDIGKEAKV
jgi:23S rRNA pseudouridine2604 synthase